MAVRKPWVERILRVTDHVHAHVDEPLDPVFLAGIAEFSLHHFHRVFRGMTGESVMGFIRRLRLERAAQRLKFGEQPVIDVALSSGYQSHEAFTRAFRARFGASPSEYRAHMRPEPSEGSFSWRDEAARVCLSLRHTGPYEQCERAWATLMAWAATHAPSAMAGEALGLCYDDPEVTEATRLRYDACLVVPAQLGHTASGDVVVRPVPAGRYAVADFVGPYENLLDTYVELLGQWLPAREVELLDEPVVEVYVNSPEDTARTDLHTQVCVRVA